jgi:sarcosine/dimethylglycine N-methyltransferase
MATSKSNAVAQAEAYYDSPDADSFYFTIWGGEDIHIGMYKDDNEPIVPASHRNDETLASMLKDVGENTTVLDIGAGYGGAARHLAKAYGCKVICVNISETQNKLNRELNKKAGLDDKVEVLHGDFEAIPAEDNSIDIVWSQDAILHSGNRPRVEAGRTVHLHRPDAVRRLP